MTHMAENPTAIERKLKAGLFINSVLPAFEDLLQHSERARSILAERQFSVRFQTSSGLKSTLLFANGQCAFKPGKTLESDIVLHFLTEEQLINEFEQSGFRVPIPIKGASRFKDLKAIKALSSELENSLRPSEAKLADTKLHGFHLSLQLGIALRAAIELSVHEPRSRSIMKDAPEGTAYFSVGEEGYGAWLEWRKGSIYYGKGAPQNKPDVHVAFSNAKTALKAIGNRIDVMSAIGLGDIRVTGLIPLADALGYIFERIPIYLEP